MSARSIGRTALSPASESGETIDRFLYGGYSTISLGYIGLYELTQLMKGVSQTDPVGAGVRSAGDEVSPGNHVTAGKRRLALALPSMGPQQSPCATALPASTRSASAPSQTSPTRGTIPTPIMWTCGKKSTPSAKFDFESQFQTDLFRRRHLLCGNSQYAPQPDGFELKWFSLFTTIFSTLSLIPRAITARFADMTGKSSSTMTYEWECPSCGNKDQTKMNVTRTNLRLSGRKLLERRQNQGD